MLCLGGDELLQEHCLADGPTLTARRLAAALRARYTVRHVHVSAYTRSVCITPHSIPYSTFPLRGPWIYVFLPSSNAISVPMSTPNPRSKAGVISPEGGEIRGALQSAHVYIYLAVFRSICRQLAATWRWRGRDVNRQARWSSAHSLRFTLQVMFRHRLFSQAASS
jgi:hypothetical protein